LLLCCRWLPPYHPIRHRRGDDDRDHTCDAEDQIRNDANPLYELDETRAEERRTARVPVAVVERVHELQHAAWEEGDEHHQQQTDVESPEARADVFLDLRPSFVIEHLTQCKGQQGSWPRRVHTQRQEGDSDSFSSL
jgi:hypothetical protein